MKNKKFEAVVGENKQVNMNLQTFAEKKTGVFPVYENQFKIGATKENATSIADMENFSVEFSNGIETWTPMDQEGWQRGLMTAKAVTISISGKRNVGDKGNDYVASKLFTNGRNSEGYLGWIFPDGTTVDFEQAIFDVKNCGAGDSTNVGPLEFDVVANGKPKVVPAA